MPTCQEGYKRIRWFPPAPLLIPVLLVMLVTTEATAETRAVQTAANHWFADDFNNGVIDPSLWQVSGDGVSESDGVLTIFRNAANDSLTTVSDYDGDYEILVDIKLTQSQAQDARHGISVTDGSNHGISFAFGYGGAFVFLEHDAPFTSFSYYAPFQIDRWYQWRLVKSGGTMDVYVDGIWICSGSVPEGSRVSFPGYYSDGGSGDGSISQINNFSISSGRRPEVEFSSAAYSVVENVTSGMATITVTLSESSAQTVTVNYETIDGTATAGGDYIATSGTITFAPGDVSETFDVPIINDSLVEAEHTLSLLLSDPHNAVLGSSREAILTIMDDERPILKVVSTDPARHQLDVSQYTNISSVFNIEVNSSTIDSSSFILSGSQSGPHLGTVNYGDAALTAMIDPAVGFLAGETVTAILTQKIRSSSGVFLRGYSWDFVTEVVVSSDGTYAERVDYPTGNRPSGTYAGDLDADGDIDLALASSDWPNPGSVSVHLNDGDGTFSGPINYVLGAARDPRDLFGADLDGDGDIDLAVSHNEPGISHLTILKNRGDATFTLHAQYTPAVIGLDIAGGDLDEDGDVDLVMTQAAGLSYNVPVMFNNGNADFVGPFWSSSIIDSDAVVVKDFDNDGDCDMGFANYRSHRVSILLNNGQMRFPFQVAYPVEVHPTDLYANDFNGDGWVDLATANYVSDDIAVLLNSGNGTFDNPVSYPSGSYPSSITGGDFDGDGDIDLTATNSEENNISVFLNNGDGTFSSRATYEVGDAPWGIQVADFDQDGDLEIVCANRRSDTLTIWFNRGIAPPAQDRLYYLPVIFH